jgi:hypothetical protein
MTQTLDRRTFLGAAATWVIAMPLVAKAQPDVSLSATPTTLVVGDVVTVAWSGINAPNGTEWIGLYAAGAGPGQYLAWRYVNGTTSPGAAFASGSIQLTVPSVPDGAYEFRLFANNYSYTLLATSNPVTVGGEGGVGGDEPFATGTVGIPNVARGDWSLAGGSGSETAIGANGAFAWGQGAQAFGGGAVALMRNSRAMYTDTFVVGQGCRADSDNGRAAGWVCHSYGDQGFAHGYQASDRGIDGLEAYAHGSFGTGTEDLGSARAQTARAVLRAQTNNATPTALTTDGRPFGFNNQMRLPDDASYVLQWLVVARDTANGDSRAWRVLAMATRGAGAGTTTVFPPTVTDIATSLGATGWRLSLTADTYNGAVQLNGIGAAGRPIQWVAAMIDGENVG